MCPNHLHSSTFVRQITTFSSLIFFPDSGTLFLMNFDMNLIDQISHFKTKELWDTCFNPPSYCLKLLLGNYVVFSFGFPVVEKDHTALCTMYANALLFCLQSYELNQCFYFSGSLNCLWLNCFPIILWCFWERDSVFLLKILLGVDGLLNCNLRTH